MGLHWRKSDFEQGCTEEGDREGAAPRLAKLAIVGKLVGKVLEKLKKITEYFGRIVKLVKPY